MFKKNYKATNPIKIGAGFIFICAEAFSIYGLWKGNHKLYYGMSMAVCSSVLMVGVIWELAQVYKEHQERKMLDNPNVPIRVGTPPR